MHKIIFSCLITLSFNCFPQSQKPRSEVIRFQSAGATIEGTLEIPAGRGKAPVAVFLHGSGERTRHDYQEWVAPLHREGWATFRYDKRGVGKSGGRYSGVGPENSIEMFGLLAGDGASAVRMLKADARIDSEKIILIGGSQAGWLIPLAASMENVKAVICISGPAVSVGEEIFYSDMAETGNASQEESDRALPGFRGFKGFDPVPYLDKLTMPSLWLLGGRDVSIPLKRTVAVLDSIKLNRRLPLEIRLYADANHGLRNAKTQMMENYVEDAVEWMRKLDHN